MARGEWWDGLMATDVERLLVRLEASAKAFENEMRKAQTKAAQSTRAIEKSFEDANQRITSELGSMGAVASTGVGKINAALAAIGVGLSLKELQSAADQFTRIMNRLRAADISEDNLRPTFDRLFSIAQRNSAPIESVATLFGRVTSVQKELKASTEDVYFVTESVSKALRINGTSAQEASGALLQLGQALGMGKIQAEEYNSLIEGLRPLLQAAATGLEEAGGSVSKLTALVKDGKVSSAAFFAAIKAGTPVLDEQLSRAQDTVSQATTRMANEFVVAVAAFDKMTGASSAVAGAIGAVADNFGTAAKAAAIAYNDVVRLTGALRQFLSTAAQTSRATFGGSPDLSRLGSAAEFGLPEPAAGSDSPLSPEITQKQRQYTESLIETNEEMRRLRTNAEEAKKFLAGQKLYDGPAGPPVPPPKVNSVSLKNFPVPGEDDDGEKGKKAAKEKQNSYERELANIEKRTAALNNEALTIGKGTLAVEKSKAAFDLERAAKEAGLRVTDALRQKIDEAAEAYAKAKLNVESITTSQARYNEMVQFAGTNISSFFSDIVSGGKNAEEAMSNLLKRLADASLQAALLGQGPLAGLFGTAPEAGAANKIGGLLGSLAGAVFGGFRADGGPVMPGRAYVVGERGPELIMPASAGVVVPNAAIRRAASGGQAGASIVMNISANGTQEVARVAYQAAQRALLTANAMAPGRVSEAALRGA